jgi:hypothetical protein
MISRIRKANDPTGGIDAFAEIKGDLRSGQRAGQETGPQPRSIAEL